MEMEISPRNGNGKCLIQFQWKNCGHFSPFLYDSIRPINLMPPVVTMATVTDLKMDLQRHRQEWSIHNTFIKIQISLLLDIGNNLSNSRVKMNLWGHMVGKKRALQRSTHVWDTAWGCIDGSAAVFDTMWWRKTNTYVYLIKNVYRQKYTNMCVIIWNYIIWLYLYDTGQQCIFNCNTHWDIQWCKWLSKMNQNDPKCMYVNQFPNHPAGLNFVSNPP